MAKYHIDSIQEWESFKHEETTYCLGHLNAHEVTFFGKDGTKYQFVVTYGLHCFTKNDTGHNIPILISDGREEQLVCLERYEYSKRIRRLIENFGEQGILIYQTATEKFFTISMLNNLTDQLEAYKVCIAVFKENGKLRIHVTSAYFARVGEGSPNTPVRKKGFSVFKIAKDTIKAPRRKNAGPKEARNRRSR